MRTWLRVATVQLERRGERSYASLLALGRRRALPAFMFAPRGAHCSASRSLAAAPGVPIVVMAAEPRAHGVATQGSCIRQDTGKSLVLLFTTVGVLVVAFAAWNIPVSFSL